MPNEPALAVPDRARLLDELRERVAMHRDAPSQVLPFGIDALDAKLGRGGIEGSGLHEIAPASATLGDDAAASLFVAGIAARFAGGTGGQVTWALTKFDLYAPGVEQAGLAPDRLLYLQGKNDVMALALAEDCLRERYFACVIAEVKAADQTATRRLQLAASDGATPMLLLKRWMRTARDPLSVPSAAMTRWRIGCVPSVPLRHAGVGRSCWSIELVRQRGGNPFTLTLEACDDTGRLALPAAAPDRADVADGATTRAA